jgi:hypothetical protein
MKKLSIFLLIAFVSILAFDTLASFASKIFQIEYGLFSLGSIVIYTGIGFFGEKYGNLALAIISSAITGIIDSTLGWYISWLIGPGRVDAELDLTIILSTIVFVAFFASLFGTIGGLISYFINR